MINEEIWWDGEKCGKKIDELRGIFKWEDV
jgi:hypothetical protein